MPALPAEPDPPTAPGAHARRHQARTTDSHLRFCARGSGAPGASGRSGGDGKRRGRAAAGRGLEGARFQCRGGTRRTNAAGVGGGIRAEGDARKPHLKRLPGFTLTSLRFSRASTTSLPSLRFLRVGWKRWLDAHRPRRCTPSRRDARSVSRRAARDPATHTRPIPSAPGRHEHLTATHLASGCDRCTHLMNSTRIPHAGRLADVRLHLTSLGVS